MFVFKETIDDDAMDVAISSAKSKTSSITLPTQTISEAAEQTAQGLYLLCVQLSEF